MRESRPVWFLSVATALACGTISQAAGEPKSVSPKVDALLEEAAKTGRAVLAVAGYEDCARCRRFRERLDGDVATQLLVSQFARLDLTINGAGAAEWRAWQRMTDTKDRSSPQVFVVRADRKVLHGGDAPGDIAGFLRTMAQQAGTPLTVAQAEQFSVLLENATALAAAGDRAGALRTLAPALKMQSYAHAAKAIREFVQALADGAGKAVDSAADMVRDDAEGVAAAVELVAIGKDFAAALPDVAKSATRQIVTLRKKPDVARILKQAEQIHAADVAARQSPSRGRALYEKIAAEHAGSGAAEVATARLEKLTAATAK